MDGRLGMIIDGTGHKFKKIKRTKERIRRNRYDCYMVFVHTDLEIGKNETWKDQEN